MIRTLCRGTALYDDRRRTNLHHVGDSSKIQNELGKTVKKESRSAWHRRDEHHHAIASMLLFFEADEHREVSPEPLKRWPLLMAALSMPQTPKGRGAHLLAHQGVVHRKSLLG